MILLVKEKGLNDYLTGVVIYFIIQHLTIQTSARLKDFCFVSLT